MRESPLAVVECSIQSAIVGHSPARIQEHMKRKSYNGPEVRRAFPVSLLAASSKAVRFRGGAIEKTTRLKISPHA